MKNNNTTPLVTIYIPSRNYSNYLENSINSIINQTYINWELIIVDEGSVDKTSTIAKKFEKENPDRITFIKNKKPQGLQKVANNILKIAKGKYMMRLDADDWLHEIALDQMVQKLEKDSEYGIVYGNYFYTNEKGDVIGVELRHNIGKENQNSQLPPHGACTLFKTDILRSVGGYSENVNAQDGWDLWYKLIKKVGAINIDLPLFYYRQHNQSLSKDNNRLLKARAKIFKEIREKLKNDYKPKVLAVIPVKESYPNMKNVPYQKINGKSLLEISINSALNSNQVNALVVSSESKSVLKFSEQLESKKIVSSHYRYLRSSNESNNIPINDFLRSAGYFYEKEFGEYPEILIYLSLHAINRNKDHIEEAINNLIISESECVVSVQEEREPMFNITNSGLNLINPGRFKDLSFEKERLYRFNGSIIASTWDNILKNDLFGSKTSFIEMNHYDSIQVKDSSLFDK